MLEIIKITQVVVSILLILLILIQPKRSSLSITSFWNEWQKFERRWPEKILHNTTIIFWILFVLNSLVFFFLA